MNYNMDIDGDIYKIDPEEIVEMIDIICAGFPCQPFSLVCSCYLLDDFDLAFSSQVPSPMLQGKVWLLPRMVLQVPTGLLLSGLVPDRLPVPSVPMGRAR